MASEMVTVNGKEELVQKLKEQEQYASTHRVQKPETDKTLTSLANGIVDYIFNDETEVEVHRLMTMMKLVVYYPLSRDEQKKIVEYDLSSLEGVVKYQLYEKFNKLGLKGSMLESVQIYDQPSGEGLELEIDM